MSTGSVSMSETGSPEEEGLVGPLLTGRLARSTAPQPPTARIGPFRVGTGTHAAHAPPAPTQEVFAGEPVESTAGPVEEDEAWPIVSGSDDAADDLPWLQAAQNEPAVPAGAGSKVGGEAETVPAFGATDLPDPWDSYLSIGGSRRRFESSEKTDTTEGAPPRSSGETWTGEEFPGGAGSATTSAPKLSAEPGRSEEVARRLERIARSIREGGPAGALHDLPGDPLAAMVAGYLLGFSGGSSPSGAGPTG